MRPLLASAPAPVLHILRCSTSVCKRPAAFCRAGSLIKAAFLLHHLVLLRWAQCHKERGPISNLHCLSSMPHKRLPHVNRPFCTRPPCTFGALARAFCVRPPCTILVPQFSHFPHICVLPAFSPFCSRTNYGDIANPVFLNPKLRLGVLCLEIFDNALLRNSLLIIKKLLQVLQWLHHASYSIYYFNPSN